MILKVFALFDTKAGYFSAPFFMGSRGEATRAVRDLAGDPGTVVGRHPADFVLYELGHWDNNTAEFQCARPESLGVVSSFFERGDQAQPGLFAAAAEA